MPLAKIHILEGRYDEARLAKVSAAVQSALMNTLRVPREDFYQLIFEMPKNRLGFHNHLVASSSPTGSSAGKAVDEFLTRSDSGSSQPLALGPGPERTRTHARICSCPSLNLRPQCLAKCACARVARESRRRRSGQGWRLTSALTWHCASLNES